MRRKPSYELPESVSDPNEEALESAIDEALEGQPRAEQWQSFVDALMIRRERLQRDLVQAVDESERAQIKAKILEVEEQIRVLDEEARITEFVEDTVKFSHEVRRLNEGG